MRIAVFHPGAQHSYETALGFQRSGHLAWYATEIFYDPRRLPYRLIDVLPRSLREKAVREFKRRYNPDLDPALVRTFGIWEWIERASMRVGLRRAEHYANEWGNRRFGTRVGAMAVRDRVDCIWGCDTSSLNAFRIGRDHGLRRVLEQTIGHPRAWNRILTEEREHTPADFDPYPLPYPESDLARVDEEIELADHVACGSPFVKSTMVEWDVSSEKLTVVPYGVRAEDFTPAASRSTDGLQLLFVGHFGMRKGAWYLLKALARLKHLSGLVLTIVGKQTVGAAYLAPVAEMLRHRSHIPRNLMPAVYRDADVLVLPSLFEGSAGATFEALASGLPIVATPNAGSVVRDGVEGFIVPMRDVDALADRIERLYGDAPLRAAMAIEARRRALQFPWERYHHDCVDLAQAVVGGCAVNSP